MAESNYIEVPASEVSRRTSEWLEWFDHGGRESVRADYDVSMRRRQRERYTGATTGWINKRPLSEEEIERKVDDYMTGGDDGDGFLCGNTLVELHMSTLDGYAKEIASLHNAATSDYPMQVRAFLWALIVAHSSEPVAPEPTT